MKYKQIQCSYSLFIVSSALSTILQMLTKNRDGTRSIVIFFTDFYPMFPSDSLVYNVSENYCTKMIWKLEKAMENIC